MSETPDNPDRADSADSAATGALPAGTVRAGDRWAAWRAGLTGPRIRGVVWRPQAPLAGTGASEARGRHVLAGGITVGGHALDTDGRHPWDQDVPAGAVQAWLHGFDWLDDLAAVPGGEGQAMAQDWLAGWQARFGRGRGPGWAPDLTGRRQMRLIAHADLVREGAPPEDRRGVLALLARQAGVLQARWRHAGAGRPRFEALAGLVWSACALEGMETALPPALGALAQECAEAIDGLGAIASRNPEELLEVFHLLTLVAMILRDQGKPADPGVDRAIARIAPVLRSLRHADGGLARMQGGGPGTPGRLDAALARSGVRPARIKGLAMGYARLGGRLVSLIVDAAPPMLGPGSSGAHASTLAFELVSGEHPVIVSAGSGAAFGAEWRRAGRATASHSTLSLAGYASARLARGAQHRPPERQEFGSGPTVVEVQEAEMKTADGIALSHDGWRATHGLVHLRSLQLDHDGSLLRGEDGLAAMTAQDRATLDRVRARLPRDAGLHWAVRFHLHPDATAEIDMGGTAVSIQLPDRETWVFRHSGGAVLSLTPAAFFDAGRARPRASKQIVLSGTLSGYGSATSWTLARPVGLLPAPGEGAPDDQTRPEGTSAP